MSRLNIMLAAFMVLSGNSAQGMTETNGSVDKTYQSGFLLPVNGIIGTDKNCKSTDKASKRIALETPTASPEAAISLMETQGPIVIDNDDESGAQVEETYHWQELPDETGQTHITTGAKFPVLILGELTSKTAKPGDPVQARLKVDLKVGGKLIAKKGAIVNGHVSSVEHSRALLHSELSVKRWFRANGALGIRFDEIISESGEHIPLAACPARIPRIVKNKAEGRILGVNDRGEIVTPLSIQLKYQAAHLAIRGAGSAAGVFSFGIVPVAYGAIGAICPSFAYGHPVGQQVRHRRLKGFALGVTAGLPGGFLITDSIIHGEEAVLKPGDELLAEFKQDFTGEPATNAELVPGATTKVHGEVVNPKRHKH